jgi:hypothetical protein
MELIQFLEDNSFDRVTRAAVRTRSANNGSGKIDQHKVRSDYNDDGSQDEEEYDYDESNQYVYDDSFGESAINTTTSSNNDTTISYQSIGLNSRSSDNKSTSDIQYTNNDKISNADKQIDRNCFSEIHSFGEPCSFSQGIV